MRSLLLFCLALALQGSAYTQELDPDAQQLYEFYEIADNPYIPKKLGLRMASYLLPPEHPMYAVLSDSCSHSRVFYDATRFVKAGFRRIAKKRSFLVGYHPEQPQWLVKGKPDVESKRKRPLHGFINRAASSRRMHALIEEQNLQHVLVPRKWIYPLPLEPQVPSSIKYPSVVIVVAETLPLESVKVTRRLWSREDSWTAEMIEDMFTLLYHEPISDCGLMNVRFSKDHQQIAFFDLEFPGTNLDLVHRKLIKFLPSKWRDYWYELLEEAECLAAE